MNRPLSILAATDFSPVARHAADRAARLAHEIGASLTLLHVLSGGALAELRLWLGAAGPGAEQQLRGDAESRLQQLAQTLQAARRVPVHTLLSSGQPFEDIGRQADAVNAAVVVAGARGKGFLRHLTVGTTAERLMRCSQRPLLLVRQNAHEAYRRVLVAVDFSPWSVPALAAAALVAPRAHRVLLSVFQVPFEDKLRFAGVDVSTVEHYRRHARFQAEQRVHALAHRVGLQPGQWEPCILEGDASRRIVEMEQEHDCDLVVLGKQGQSATADLLLGSVTKHVLAEGSSDLLVSTAQQA